MLMVYIYVIWLSDLYIVLKIDYQIMDKLAQMIKKRLKPLKKCQLVEKSRIIK